MRSSPIAGLVAVLMAGACWDSPATQPNPPATVAAVTGVQQTAAAGQLVPVTPSFVVKDAQGRPMTGVAVTVTVADGGGSVSNGAVLANGTTLVGQWKVGTTPGQNHLTVSVTGLPAVTFTATVVAGPPASVTVLSGNGQAGRAGDPTTPITLRVQDQFGNAVSGAAATFAVVAGGGTLAASTASSATDGSIAVPTWILGKSAVPQTIHTTIGTLSVDITASIATSFNIVVRFYGPAMTAAQQAMFLNAAARISAIVTGDVPDADGGGASVCGISAIPPLNETVDDIVIYATAQPIDGAGGTLAQSGPCILRSPQQHYLPVAGVMQFDSDDLAPMAAAGTLQDVITHEMLHVLGVGTLWQTLGMLTAVGTPGVAYTGAQAAQGCRDSGGAVVCASNVPVENTGGAGTINTHWRESVFQSELMTGYVNTGGMPLSTITIGSLEDLGYQVNRDAADLYTVPASAALRSQTAAPAVPWERTVPGGVVVLRAPGGGP